MTDIVIPLGWGSTWDNQELKFSLRSFERHLSGIGKLFIVTDLSGIPDFLQGHIHLPCPDDTNLAAVNTYKKILKACRDNRVSEDFLLSNDDFYLNHNFQAATFPNYHRGQILAGWDKIPNKTSHYVVSKKITASVLKKRGFTTFHFGIHCPILINKTKFLELVPLFKWEQSKGYLTRCIYGNVLQLPATYHRDTILNLPLSIPLGSIDKHPFFSVRHGKVNEDMKGFFQRLYPDKSRWEK